MTISEDLLRAEKLLRDYATIRLDPGLHDLADRIRAHASLLDRIERELRALMRSTPAFRRQHGELADALKTGSPE